MLDHIGPQNVGPNYKMDGAAHPHRGFETITFMFDGIMHHKDSLGNKATLNPGSVQRMNAGSGIQHGGDMRVDKKSGIFHEVQLWVNLPAEEKMSLPEIQNAGAADIPIISQGNSKIRIIAGELDGIKGPIVTKNPIMAIHIISEKEASVHLKELPEDYTTLIYVLTGQASIENAMVDSFQTLVFEAGGSEISLKAGEKSELLFLSGKPIEESVAMGGPFVMNTNEEIDQAYADFNEGKFGTIN